MSASPQAVQSVGIFHGSYYLSIAGNLVKSQDSFDVINPATQGVDIPFGGHQQSGLGTEHGAEGRQLFTNPKTVLIRKAVRQP